jgi:hypothetical protein
MYRPFKNGISVKYSSVLQKRKLCPKVIVKGYVKTNSIIKLVNPVLRNHNLFSTLN